MTDRPSKEPLPSESTKRDVRDAVIKGALSAIPFGVGGAAAELFGLLSIPLAHRRETWFQDLADRLGELEGYISGFRLDTLADNEQFVSATLQATQAALRTHQQEKLEALRNAVLNSAAKREPHDDYQTVFLALVDRFSPAHLRLLKSFRSPGLTKGASDYLRWKLEGWKNRDGTRCRVGFAITVPALGTLLKNLFRSCSLIFTARAFPEPKQAPTIFPRAKSGQQNSGTVS
jgi:hypothetical protein